MGYRWHLSVSIPGRWGSGGPVGYVVAVIAVGYSVQRMTGYTIIRSDRPGINITQLVKIGAVRSVTIVDPVNTYIRHITGGLGGAGFLNLNFFASVALSAFDPFEYRFTAGGSEFFAERIFVLDE